MQKNQPAVLNAWCAYDWANSVYALAISSAIFPIYYNSATRAAFGGERVTFFSLQLENSVLYSYSLSAAFLLVALLSPLLSGMADSGGVKKRMLQIFTWTGALSCAGLFFFTGGNVEFGILMSMLACVGYAGAQVFYNAYLPEIATPDRFDTLSARGFSLGYIGGVVQLVASLLLLLRPDWFGLSDGLLPARISFLLVGVWWLGFALLSFRYLPKDSRDRQRRNHRLLARGYRELLQVGQQIRAHKSIKRFLLAFFSYNMGVQTVMLLAATFGEKEIGLDDDKLIATVLVLQLVAIPGAYGFAYLSGRYGNRFSLMLMVAIWVGICLYAYQTYTPVQFYLLATAVGLVMGGIQSLSRATYAKLLPANTPDPTSFFSFYDVTDKLAVVCGTFVFGLVEQLTESMRFSALALSLFFLAGLLLLARFRMPQSTPVNA